MTGHLLRLEAAGTSLDAVDDEMKKMLADFRKEEFLQHADFETPYQDQQPTLPLGEEPLMVTDTALCRARSLSLVAAALANCPTWPCRLLL